MFSIYKYITLNMFHNYMFRPFSLGHLQVVYTRPYITLNMFHNYMFRPFSLGHLQVVYTRT